jgi:hypothetical protein
VPVVFHCHKCVVAEIFMCLIADNTGPEAQEMDFMGMTADHNGVVSRKRVRGSNGNDEDDEGDARSGQEVQYDGDSSEEIS